MLENHANVHAQTQTGDTALSYACENGHTDVAEILLMYGANLEHESEGGRTPMMKACRAGHLCTVKFLINRGASVNKQTSNNDHTPLSLACAGGHQTVVELLLAHHADPFHRLKDNSTMLIEAAKGGHLNVVQLLLDYPQSLSKNQQLLPNAQISSSKHSQSSLSTLPSQPSPDTNLVSEKNLNETNPNDDIDQSELLSYNDYFRNNSNFLIDSSPPNSDTNFVQRQGSVLAQMRLLQINNDGFKEGLLHGFQIDNSDAVKSSQKKSTDDTFIDEAGFNKNNETIDLFPRFPADLKLNQHNFVNEGDQAELRTISKVRSA